MTAERFGQVLSRMRLKRKITSRELANKINMPPSVYIDIEHSRAWPSNDLLTKFEKALDLEPHECSILEYAWNNDHMVSELHHQGGSVMSRELIIIILGMATIILIGEYLLLVATDERRKK